MENCSSTQKYLHDAAKDCLKRMKSAAEANPATSIIFVKALSSSPGSLFFDRITKTKTLEEILSHADNSSFQNTLEFFESSIINQKGDDQKSADNARQAIADTIVGSFKLKTKANSVQEKSKTPHWISDITQLFLKSAYCLPRTQDSTMPQPPVSAEGRAMFHSRLTSIFGHLLSTRTSFAGVLAWKTIKKLKSMTKSSKPYRLSLEADDAILELISKSYAIAEQLADELEDQSANPFQHAILILFCLTMFQVYSGDTSAVVELEDLNQFYQANVSKQDSTIHFDLLLELLLGLLSKQSALFRTMAEQVFAAISNHVSEEGLSSLFNILQASESASGQAELFQAEDNEANDSDEDSDELDSDVEVIDQADKSSEDTDSEDDSESDDEEDISDANDKEQQEFNDILAKVLQPSNNKDGDDESDDESMDDDDMMALDNQIISIFKERKILVNKSKEKKAARGNVVNFKRRVLDLLSIYAKQETSNPLSLSILLPLLRVLRTTQDKSIESKTIEVLKVYYNTSSKTKTLPELETCDSTWDILSSIHQEVQQQSSKAHTAACSRASLFVVKVLVSQNKKNYDKAVSIYSDTQRIWFRKKNMSVQPTFFTEWISWSFEMRKQH
jgi:DNA polymerase phi